MLFTAAQAIYSVAAFVYLCIMQCLFHFIMY